MEKEIWKPVKEYEGIYEVSNYGRVRSIGSKHYVNKGTGGFYRFRKGCIFKIQNASNGYKQVVLSKNGEHRIYRVHRLVAEAFIPNPLRLPEVNHKDEDRTNNNVDNLEWCTHQYNNSYGNKPARGSKNPMARLTNEQVKEIRKRRAAGELLRTIAEDYGISLNHVGNIVNGRRWASELSNN